MPYPIPYRSTTDPPERKQNRTIVLCISRAGLTPSPPGPICNGLPCATYAQTVRYKAPLTGLTLTQSVCFWSLSAVLSCVLVAPTHPPLTGKRHRLTTEAQVTFLWAEEAWKRRS